MQKDEKEIMDLLSTRIAAGRKEYGPWRIKDDPRNYTEEILMEVIDALHYCSAQIIRIRRQNESHPLIICIQGHLNTIKQRLKSERENKPIDSYQFTWLTGSLKQIEMIEEELRALEGALK